MNKDQFNKLIEDILVDGTVFQVFTEKQWAWLKKHVYKIMVEEK